MTIGIAPIGKYFLDQVVFSLKCPNCGEQTLLKPDTLDKPEVYCGGCKCELYIQPEQKRARIGLITAFECSRKRLQTSGLEVWILGNFQPTDFYYNPKT